MMAEHWARPHVITGTIATVRVRGTTNLPDYDYVYPKLARAGLGNLLFPWAKAVVLSSRLGVEMLPPKWLKIRVGPILRGELDKRRYHELFTPPSANAAARRMWLLSTATLWSEDGELLRRGSKTCVLVVQTMDDYFAPLLEWRELIFDRLTQAVRSEAILGTSRTRPYIAVHMRLGPDFIRPEANPFDMAINVTTPVDWFVAATRCVRAAGWEDDIIICSDGRDAELAPLLAEPGVTRSIATNALADMLILARARVVIGSGSSFSAWGAFLGDKPMYVAPDMNHFLPGHPGVHEISSWDDDSARRLLSAEFEPIEPEVQR
jgi:hypothetical protein